MASPEDRYLKWRDGHWHYQRRVPKRVSDLDSRGLIQVTLNTQSLETARLRRDAFKKADDEYWAGLQAAGRPGGAVAQTAYARAQRRALALGFTYQTADELMQQPLEELVQRVEKLEGSPTRADTEALLGGVELPKMPVSQAIDEHIARVLPLETKGMSPGQARRWENVKRRAPRNFIGVCGDVAMEDITEEISTTYFDWWRNRIAGVGEHQPVTANSANREIGNMRGLYREHFFHHGERKRPNPFDGLSFSDPKTGKKKRPAFPVTFIEETILQPEPWANLNRQAALIFFATIETGCRPGEICNLIPADIRLDHEVPHLSIQPRADRAIKTQTSERLIPLLGASLAAIKAAPEGFPRYYDKESSWSATINKYMRANGLVPSPDHTAYSMRHSFESRMLAGGLDTELRKRILGHDLDREDYGDGGSLAFRAEQLSKIVLPSASDLMIFLSGG